MIKACMVLEAHRGAQKEYRLSSFYTSHGLSLFQKERKRIGCLFYTSHDLPLIIMVSDLHDLFSFYVLIPLFVFFY